ncbi:hypothetical protein GKZ90_0020650 [Flavobacterium sp. MC2016-06]|jgi:hypothetical protein|nr:hypothetical protein [Flavobacterium sp. MC2016-06]
MLENFLKSAKETETLTKTQQKAIQGGDAPESEELRKGKVA